MNICFIGFGNIAKAIAQGLVAQKKHTIYASTPTLTEGINPQGIRTFNDNKKAVHQANIIILAVKPALMAQVLKDINPLPPSCLLISVATGLNLAWFARHCGAQHPLIRAMPNTPAAIGLAATPLIANKAVSTAQKQAAEDIFSSIGITTWAEQETDIESFVALSGSGPAYVFLFIEALIQGGMDLGLNESVAKTFALETVLGAVELAKTSDFSVTQLRNQVTSPGGTTEAALRVLHPTLEALILSAMKAARDRAIELGTSY